MDILDLVVVGGGASGFMTAITASENGVKKIRILEASPKLLEKVRVSGGGRCNVTNASWIPDELSENYPRGGVKLIESFSRFACGDVFEWFENKGVKLKIEEDSRIFPVSNSSLSIVNCLKNFAETIGIQIETKTYVKRIINLENNYFKVFISDKEYLISKKITIATGSHPSGYKLAKELGHQIIKPVPSLFTFSCRKNPITEYAGISIKNIFLEIVLKNQSFTNKGDLLITHLGFSGPGILKLSSIAARLLSEEKYKFKLIIKWSDVSAEDLFKKINDLRVNNGKSSLSNLRPLPYITKRLWIFLLEKIKINQNKKWSEIFSYERKKLIDLLLCDEYQITGKGYFGDEFVTAGGVSLSEVNFKTMESLVCKGLYFAGEVLDVDGITGGFNFQHCWTSGWLAGKAIAR